MVASGSSNAYEALMVRSDDSFLPVEITNVNISKKERLAIARDITAHCCQQGPSASYRLVVKPKKYAISARSCASSATS